MCYKQLLEEVCTHIRGADDRWNTDVLDWLTTLSTHSLSISLSLYRLRATCPSHRAQWYHSSGALHESTRHRYPRAFIIAFLHPPLSFKFSNSLQITFDLPVYSNNLHYLDYRIGLHKGYLWYQNETAKADYFIIVPVYSVEKK